MKIRFGVFTLESDLRQVVRRQAHCTSRRKRTSLLAVLVADRPKVLSKDGASGTLVAGHVRG
jgi:DNA-binding winged helix-turn-helix (wHTH) protein